MPKWLFPPITIDMAERSRLSTANRSRTVTSSPTGVLSP